MKIKVIALDLKAKTALKQFKQYYAGIKMLPVWVTKKYKKGVKNIKDTTLEAKEETPNEIILTYTGNSPKGVKGLEDFVFNYFLQQRITTRQYKIKVIEK